jgi:hypothetical protein
MVRTSCLTLGGPLLCSVCTIKQATPKFKRGSCHRNGKVHADCPCDYCSRPDAQVDPRAEQRRTGRARSNAAGAGEGGVLTLDFLPTSVAANVHRNNNQRKREATRYSEKAKKQQKKPASRAARKRLAEVRLRDAPLAGTGSGYVDTPPKKQRTWAL